MRLLRQRGCVTQHSLPEASSPLQGLEFMQGLWVNGLVAGGMWGRSDITLPAPFSTMPHLTLRCSPEEFVPPAQALKSRTVGPCSSTFSACSASPTTLGHREGTHLAAPSAPPVPSYCRGISSGHRLGGHPCLEMALSTSTASQGNSMAIISCLPPLPRLSETMCFPTYCFPASQAVDQALQFFLLPPCLLELV